MFDYLQQFNKLPNELKDRVSSPLALEIISELEKKYRVNLALFIIKIMVKAVLIKDAKAYLVSNLGLSESDAEALFTELKEKLLFSLSIYLGLKVEERKSENLEFKNTLQKEGIDLQDEDLIKRGEQILLTYQKGIRAKIDARAALSRAVESGGLGLSKEEADRLLEEKSSLSQSKDPKTEPQVEVSSDTKLDKSKSEIDNLIKEQAILDYDFRNALAEQSIKVPSELQDEFQAKEKDLKLEAEKLAEISGRESFKEIALSKAAHLAIEAAEDSKLLQASPKEEGKEDLIVPGPKPKKEEPQSSLKELDLGTQIETGAQAAVVDKKPEAREEQLEEKAKTQEVPDLPLRIEKAPKRNRLSFFRAKEEKTKPDINVSSSNLAQMVEAANIESSGVSRSSPASSHRSRMDDVKNKPKVMSPIDELRYLDLVNFRRLGESPAEISKKIIMKIKLLEKNGYDKMLEGVKAWRQSPVNRSYIKLSQEAIKQGVSLADLLTKRKEEGRETLKMEEILEIISMNNKLMF